MFAGKKEVGKCLKIIIYACFILSGGILYLLCRWFPKLQTALFTRPCSLREATHIFVTNSFRKLELVKVQNLPLTEIIEKNGWPNESPYKKYMHNSGKSKESSISIFDYRFNRFILDPKSGIFIPINKILISCLPIAENNTKGLKNASVEWAKTFLGSNLINLPEKGYGLIFWEEVLHPFNVFQLLCIIWWACTEYFQYSVVIFLMSGFSMLLMVFETRKNMIKMNKMTRFECPTRILRDGIFVEESSAVLVPGDLIVLDENIETLPCDGILVNGDAIMDECMLTGETIPVTKIDIDDEQYKSSKQNESFADQFLLHSGTRLLRCRSRHGKPTMLLVTNTGFHTTKGNLIQSILFPRPNNFRFYRDSMIFIGIIAFIASFGFIFALISFIRANSSVQIIVERAFDAIAIILPPALPASMAVGTIFAIKRLEKRLIFCISPPRINVSSKINTMCFDKTGTMTEDGLEIFCVIPTYKFKGESNLTPTQHLAENIEFIEIDQKLAPVKTTTAQYIFKDNEPVKSCTDLPYMQNSQALHLLKLMATCHNIKKVNGRLLGDSLDLSMLEFTGWTLEESIDMDESIMPTILRPPVEDIPDSKSSSKSSFFDLKPDSFESNAKVMIEELGIIRHFDFSAALRRMSVVVRNVSASDKNPILYTKGSPEVIYNICDPHTCKFLLSSSLFTTYFFNR